MKIIVTDEGININGVELTPGQTHDVQWQTANGLIARGWAKEVQEGGETDGLQGETGDPPGGGTGQPGGSKKRGKRADG